MKTRKAFTLIELLVVVAIIALLIALLLPSLSKARDEAKTVRCGANLHQICIGVYIYASQNKDLMPQSNGYSVAQYPATNNNPPKGYLPLSWAESLFVDGAFTMNSNWTGTLNNNGGWGYFAEGYGIFQCICHDASFEFGDDTNYNQGYGMAWCATSDFNFVTALSTYPFNFPLNTPKISVSLRNLNSSHIIVAEGWEQMGRAGAYPNPAASQYGVFQRHKRNNILGANYLMAGGSVEWSSVYGGVPSPLNYNTDVSAANKSKSRIWVHGVGDN